MTRALSVIFLAMLGCGGSEKQRPPPAEQSVVLDSKPVASSDTAANDAPVSAPPATDTSTNVVPGATPDISGVVIGTRADQSPPLQGVSPESHGGNSASYKVDASKPFMGLPLIEKTSVTVENGKITFVGNRVDAASCPQLIEKLTAAYGHPTKTKNPHWLVGSADVFVVGHAGRTCDFAIVPKH